MDSIMQGEKKCYVCGTTADLHKHHIFYGANRKMSDREGCWCYLCAFHHNMSDFGVHFDKELDLELKRICQTKWERLHGKDRGAFRELFGRSWI